MHESAGRIGLVICALEVAACGYPLLPQLGDGGVTDGDHLTFSFADFKLAQLQTARLHVQLVHHDGTMQDVTAEAMYTSDNPAIAMVAGPGLVDSGSQAGTATIKASLGAAMPATVKASVTTITCHPVINELFTGSAVSPADEWVEVYNPCTNSVDVTDWTLVFRGADVTGPQDQTLLMTLAGQMASSELRLYAGDTYTGDNDGKWLLTNGLISQSNGAVGLRNGPKDIGALIDSIAYGSAVAMNPFIEANPTPMMANGLSASRLPFDGNDTDDGAADFVILSTPTPRALNVP